jgi:hypothetical protein
MCREYRRLRGDGGESVKRSKAYDNDSYTIVQHWEQARRNSGGVDIETLENDAGMGRREVQCFRMDLCENRMIARNSENRGRCYTRPD